MELRRPSRRFGEPRESPTQSRRWGEAAIKDLGEFKRRWPTALSRVITGRHPLENYRELLLGKAIGIKNVITLA